MTARGEILTALGTVTGLVPVETHPSAPVPGSAWPKWVQSRFGGRLRYLTVNDYDVCVVLPAGTTETAVETADGLVDSVSTALLKIGTIEYCQPVAFTFDDGTTMPGIQFRFTPTYCQ